MLTRPTRREGFTLIEVIVALLILATAVLGLAATASRLSTNAASAQLRALALEAAEDRITEVRLDPRYEALDSLYSAVDTDILGADLPGYTRTTTVQRVDQPDLKYTRVSVDVTGPNLNPPISRQITVGAP